jgi:hypothetical protein
MPKLNFEVSGLRDFNAHLNQTFRTVHEALGKQNAYLEGLLLNDRGKLVSTGELDRGPQGSYFFSFILKQPRQDITRLIEMLGKNSDIKLLGVEMAEAA